MEVQRSIQKVRSDIDETASLWRKSKTFKAVKVRDKMLDTSQVVFPEVETIISPEVGFTSRAVTILQKEHKCSKDFPEAEFSMNGLKGHSF